jgi:hypothetical protein
MMRAKAVLLVCVCWLLVLQDGLLSALCPSFSEGRWGRVSSSLCGGDSNNNNSLVELSLNNTMSSIVHSRIGSIIHLDLSWKKYVQEVYGLSALSSTTTTTETVMNKKDFNIFYRSSSVRVLLLSWITSDALLVSSTASRVPLYGTGYSTHTDPFVFGHKTHIGNTYKQCIPFTDMRACSMHCVSHLSHVITALITSRSPAPHYISSLLLCSVWRPHMGGGQSLRYHLLQLEHISHLR